MHPASARPCLFARRRMSREVSSARINTNESSPSPAVSDRQMPGSFFRGRMPVPFFREPPSRVARSSRNGSEFSTGKYAEFANCSRVATRRNSVSERRGMFNEKSVWRFYSFPTVTVRTSNLRDDRTGDGPREVWKWRRTFCGTYVS